MESIVHSGFFFNEARAFFLTTNCLLRPVSRTEPRKRVELVLDRGKYTTALLTFGLWVACFLLRAFKNKKH